MPPTLKSSAAPATPAAASAKEMFETYRSFSPTFLMEMSWVVVTPTLDLPKLMSLGSSSTAGATPVPDSARVKVGLSWESLSMTSGAGRDSRASWARR